MTLIIGAKFKDGVIIVSDRKVTEMPSGRNYFENKIITPLPIPLGFAASGYEHKFKQFNRRILELIDLRQREVRIKNIAYYKEHNLKYIEQQIKKNQPKKLATKEIENEAKNKINKTSEDVFLYSTEDFIKDCSDLINELCTERDEIVRPLLDVILAINTNGARIHHIDYSGDEQEVNYCAIGSGSPYIDLFLRKFWDKDMSIRQILTLCFFCIYYVQDLELDKGVGMEDNILPDYLIVTHDGSTAYWKELSDNLKLRQEIHDEVRDKVRVFKELAEGLSFK